MFEGSRTTYGARSTGRIRVERRRLDLSRLLPLLGCVLLLSACTTGKLPDYAAPSVTYVDSEDIDMSDVISYRQLTRDDFRGEKPPADFDERMAAVTCVYTQPLVDRNGIVIEPVDSEDGEQFYQVTFNNLRYRALMNRNCSWWNPRTNGLEEDYVLEHEQIHFALFEAAAREWGEMPPLRLRVKAQSRSAMRLEVQQQFEARMQQRLAALREQNYRFDEDTSVGLNPVKQKKWLNSVMARLRKTGGVEDESGTDCEASQKTREIMLLTRMMLNNADDPVTITGLLEEARLAAGPHECDDARARILAQKAYDLASAGSVPACEPDASALHAILRARDALPSGPGRARGLQLIKQAETAAMAPECDSVRARILAEKAIELAPQLDRVSPVRSD